MPAKINLTNRLVGKITVTSESGHTVCSGRKIILWNGVCACGKPVAVRADHLQSGHTTSCGCARSESIARHGHARREAFGGKTPTYEYWKMFRRRKIGSICQEWDSYENFLADVGERPADAKALVEIIPGGGYMLGNVRWSTEAIKPQGRPPELTISIGQRFGKWIVQGPPGDGMVPVKCDCGAMAKVGFYALMEGRTLSCGCSKMLRIKHGQARRNTIFKGVYKSWRAMIARCKNPKIDGYKNYGGRGIVPCAGFKDSKTFMAVMGERPPNKTLERKDVNSGYYCGNCPECIANKWPFNCEWATTTEQMRNRRNTVMVTLDGITMPLIEACEKFHVDYRRAYSRIYRGWNHHNAMFSH